MKSLSSTINCIFQKSLSAQEIETLLAGLEKRGAVNVHENNVTYFLPASSV